MRVKRIVDKKRVYVFPHLPVLSFSLLLSPSVCMSLSLSLFLSLSCLSYIIYLAHTFYLSISFHLQPEERKKLLSLKETPSLKDNKGSSRERSPSATPSVRIEDSTDGNEDGQSDREASHLQLYLTQSCLLDLTEWMMVLSEGVRVLCTHYEMLISSNLQCRLFTTCSISTSN